MMAVKVEPSSSHAPITSNVPVALIARVYWLVFRGERELPRFPRAVGNA
jgi:hypothetical protein